MEKIYWLLACLLLLQSCSQKSAKKSLNGNWRLVRIENINDSDTPDWSAINKSLEKGVDGTIFSFNDTGLIAYDYVDTFLFTTREYALTNDSGTLKTSEQFGGLFTTYKLSSLAGDSAKVKVTNHYGGTTTDSTLYVLVNLENVPGKETLLPHDTLYRRLQKSSWKLVKERVVFIDKENWGSKSKEETATEMSQLKMKEIELFSPHYLFFDTKLIIKNITGGGFGDHIFIPVRYSGEKPLVHAETRSYTLMYSVLGVTDSTAFLKCFSLDQNLKQQVESILEFKATTLHKDSLAKEPVSGGFGFGSAALAFGGSTPSYSSYSGRTTEFKKYRKNSSLHGKIIDGGRSRASVMRTIRREFKSLRYPYNERVLENPGLQGVIKVKMVINQQGQVLSCNVVNSTMNDAPLEQEIVAKIKKWEFGKINIEGDETTVSYPFTFRK